MRSSSPARRSPPRAPSNERSWLYRIRPTIAHWGQFRRADNRLWRTAPAVEAELPIAPLRWDPFPVPQASLSFIEGMHTVTTAGDARSQSGMGAHVYLATRSMTDEYFYNADAEMLILPQQGGLRLRTEFGVIEAGPGEAVVIPRGVKISVVLLEASARGYVCENYGGALALPERGPIGANCMANPRDFLTPVAAFEDRDAPGRMIVKWGGNLWVADIAHSPLDVVAWHGNYAPYKYDLRRYAPVGPVLFDHADPSIFTVLTSPSETPGTANIDFVLFSDRWLVAEATFRPPWYHMNVMSEFMGLIYGTYDAKTGGGFVPGGHLAAQRHAAARPGHGRVRAGEQRRAETPQAGGHDGVHVRDPLPPDGHGVRRRVRATASGLPGLWAVAAEAFRPRPAMTAAPLPRPIAAGVRIGHVHLKVADLDRALAFYVGVLGFELMQRFGSQAAFISAGGYHHQIGLNTWESRHGAPPPAGSTGLYHLAILYPDRADLADALRRLSAAGIDLDGAADHGVSEALYLSDPDRNGVELYWDRPTDQWPRAEDGSLAMVTHRLDLAGLLAEPPVA